MTSFAPSESNDAVCSKASAVLGATIAAARNGTIDETLAFDDAAEVARELVQAAIDGLDEAALARAIAAFSRQ